MLRRRLVLSLLTVLVASHLGVPGAEARAPAPSPQVVPDREAGVSRMRLREDEQHQVAHTGVLDVSCISRCYASEWGERVRIRGGRGRLDQSTPPA